MPVPKSSKTDESTAAVAANSGPVSTIIETEPVVNPVDVTEISQIQDTATNTDITSTTDTTDTTAPAKPKRGRRAGAPPAIAWSQPMFNAMRREARRLASQQLAAGLEDAVDPGKLLEAVKASHDGFEAVDRARLVSKYKEGQKQISKSAKAEEIAAASMEHPLYLPPLTSNRSKIDFLALDEAE